MTSWRPEASTKMRALLLSQQWQTVGTAATCSYDFSQLWHSFDGLRDKFGNTQAPLLLGSGFAPNLQVATSCPLVAVTREASVYKIMRNKLDIRSINIHKGMFSFSLKMQTKEERSKLGWQEETCSTSHSNELSPFYPSTQR